MTGYERPARAPVWLVNIEHPRERIRAYRLIAEDGQPIADSMLAASGEVMASLGGEYLLYSTGKRYRLEEAEHFTR